MPGPWVRSLAVYRDPRVLSIVFFGFASGLPLLLVGPTLSAWLRDKGVSLTEIGFVTLVGMAYGLKFLWAPLVDRLPLPFLTRRLGRRRAWLLASQGGLMAALPVLGSADPATPEGLQAVVTWGLVVAFLSATQDIAVDAYRTEILDERTLGAGAASVQFGYRIGMLAGGGGCLIVADLAGWFAAYAVMAGLMSVGVLATLLNPEPAAPAAPVPSLAPRDRMDRLLGRAREAAVRPFLEFTTRPGWWAILLFVAFYRYGDSLLGVMANPFYLDLGFTKTQIGVVSKGFGLAMTLLGTAFAGVLVARVGILRSLLVGGVLQAASNLMFVFQAVVGPSVPALAATIAVENLSGGIAAGAFVAYLSSLCNVAFTATQYALLSSLAAFAGRLFASTGGAVADRVSWAEYFALTTVAALPGLLLLVWMTRRFPPAPVPRLGAARVQGGDAGPACQDHSDRKSPSCRRATGLTATRTGARTARARAGGRRSGPPRDPC